VARQDPTTRLVPLTPSLVPLATLPPLLLSTITPEVPVTSFETDITAPLPVVDVPEAEVHDPSQDDTLPEGLAQSAIEAILTSGLADEVADAVRRALAAIDAAAQPEIPLSPLDFMPSETRVFERSDSLPAH
jgi:hypothetical protein